jgi:hypothetical protein
MRLTPEDQTWLEAYRQALAQQFPALVQHLILFGSKARGAATAYSIGMGWDAEAALHLVEDAQAFLRRVRSYLRSVGIAVEGESE